ncbi:hypothetical protein OBBRIDRAFT_325702 [Obba rivulosa]|uniref:O-methyltransferase domain-containing protein n=1 Tax=Obba rivulosa TaxID=1052685 RepID=A0A8E2AIP0_9APHY|nr:hypothetical protein OBBRIDRAFT_325702 [Obba rivulosa]
MTFATLRALHAIIGAAIDDIEQVYLGVDAQQGHPISPASPTSPCNSRRAEWPPPSPTTSVYSSTDSNCSVDDIPRSSPEWKESAYRVVRDKDNQIRTKTPSPPSPVSPVTPSRQGRQPSVTSPRTPGASPSTPRRSGDTSSSAGQDSPCTPRNRDDSPYVSRPSLRYAPHSPPGLRSVTSRRDGDTPSTPSQASPSVHRRRESAPYAPSTSAAYSPQQSRRRIEVPYTPYAPHDRAYGQPRLPHSPPPTPATRTFSGTPLDYPSLDAPFYPSEKAEKDTSADPNQDSEAQARAESLTSHPAVIAASNKIVAACGQLSASVQRPFLSICDAAMGYHLPACLRLIEATNTVELLRAAGPRGLHVRELARRIAALRAGRAEPTPGDLVEVESGGEIDPSKLSHVLRLLATHHITREVRPDVFANNRVSAAMDSGRSPRALAADPDAKYDGTDGIAAFVGLCTDELFKASAYLTDCYLPQPQASASSKKGSHEEQEKGNAPAASATSPSDLPPDPTHPMHAPFNLAFRTGTPYFEWLEHSQNAARLRRFGRAMTGTGAWEVPGAVIGGFPWHTLPAGALVVDVGGGIGSTSMLLGHAFPHLRFLVQDRPQTAKMGEAAWRARCSELLDTGRAAFQGHDFFAPQPPWPASLRSSIAEGHAAEYESEEARKEAPAVFLLRVITHDWPDEYVTRILLHLRRSASSDTRLLLADYVLPLACIDEDDDGDLDVSDAKGGRTHMRKKQPLPGAMRTLAPEGSPLLPNLGKANANAYWLDLTMRVTFNSQERTLREIVALTLTAGWKVVQVTRSEGSLFGHIIAEPVDIPQASLTLLSSPLPGSAHVAQGATDAERTGNASNAEKQSKIKSPAMGDTFCSRVDLPSEDAIRWRFGRKASGGLKSSPSISDPAFWRAGLIWRGRKKRPQPLVVDTSAAQGLHASSSSQGDRRGYAPSPAPTQETQPTALLPAYEPHSPLRTRSKSRAGANEVQVQEATSRIEGWRKELRKMKSRTQLGSMDVDAEARKLAAKQAEKTERMHRNG